MLTSIAVLASGGLDSCILLSEFAAHHQVYPLYVRAGLIWEAEELSALNRYLSELHHTNIQPVTILDLPIKSIYGHHWSLSGENIPSKFDADEHCYLPGRNVLLLSLAAVWCSLNHVSKIAIGSLKGNPFPDATTSFFQNIQNLLSQALNTSIEIEAPFREKYSKEELISQYAHLPLELSLTCQSPIEHLHCGECNKCFERQKAFKAAGIRDKSIYTNTAS